MKISDHRITIKTLRPSEHGWSKYSHQTHIGCCENYIDNWEGKSNEGNQLPVGTYFYHMIYDENLEKTGWVYLNY